MGQRSTLQPASVALPEPATARRAFDRAAARFDSACAAHDHARGILLERLAWLELAPQLVVDAGCGTGRALPLLQQQFPDAAIVGVDCSSGMLQIADGRAGAAVLACGDIAALPFAPRSVDLLLANLVLPWTDPVMVLEECRRVLTPDGLLLLSTTGPATLQQLRRAWRSVDDDVHVHANLDMQTLGDLVMQAGLRDPVLDVEHVTLQYSSPARLHAELHSLGAGNTAPGRRSSLTGKARFSKYEQALRAAGGDGPDGVNVTLELIFLQAWGDTQAAPPEPQFQGIPLRRQ